MDPSLLVCTRDLRRAVAVRILATDFVGDHTVYIVDVVDIESKSQWRVRKRFREFFELQVSQSVSASLGGHMDMECGVGEAYYPCLGRDPYSSRRVT